MEVTATSTGSSARPMNSPGRTRPSGTTPAPTSSSPSDDDSGHRSGALVPTGEEGGRENEEATRKGTKGKWTTLPPPPRKGKAGRS